MPSHPPTGKAGGITDVAGPVVDMNLTGKALKCPECKWIVKGRGWDCLADSPRLWGERGGEDPLQ